MNGRIHSIETFGTVDGPGIRYVVFFQGCPMRCLYCHNPDTRDSTKGKEMSVNDIIAPLIRNRPFYRSGGITATGGEPTMQKAFLTELFKFAHENAIHTALDTSGIYFDQKDPEKSAPYLKYTDLVILDIKHSDPKGHKTLVGYENTKILAFADYLDSIGKPMWLRHVVVPGYTDSEEELIGFARIVAAHNNVQKWEVLPYHTLGIEKYEKMGIPYPLEGVPQLSAEEAQRARDIIEREISVQKANTHPNN